MRGRASVRASASQVYAGPGLHLPFGLGWVRFDPLCTKVLTPRAAVGMGIPMGIPMGMGMVWVWGL